MIVRISKARVRPGQEQAFERFTKERGVPLVQRQKGIRQIVHGWDHGGAERTYCFISVWDSLEDVKRFAGPQWQRSVMLPDEEKLVFEMTCQHFGDLPG